MTIKNAYRRGATTIYQRSVPVDLMGRYPGKNIKVDLKTSDPVKVARMVERLNAKVEAEWAGLRASPDSSPTSLKAHAREYLGRWGLEPGATGEAAGVAIDLLHDHWDDKRAAHAAGDEEKHREATPEDYLSPVELAAWKALHVPPKPTVGDLRDLYLSTHKKRDDPKFRKLTDIAFDGLIAVAGDRDLSSFTREDARLYIAAQLDKGNKTGTVRRRLNTFVAAWAAYSREAATDLRNPFERLAIAGEGDDRAERKPFSADDLAALAQACRAADDDPRWLFALMIDTGARIGEIAGLALDDLRLSGAVPYVVIQAHPWRSLKTTNSAREVPLGACRT